MSFWGKRKPSNGAWLQHPCSRPGWDDLDTEDEGTIIGNVWACACGRRWQCVDVATVVVNEQTGDFFVQLRWAEMLNGEVTDRDLEMFQQWTKEASA